MRLLFPSRLLFVILTSSFRRVTPTADSRYVLLPGGAYDSCPPGRDVPQDDCLAAGNEVTQHYTITNRDALNVFDDGAGLPCGCFIWGENLIDFDTSCGNKGFHRSAEVVCLKDSAPPPSPATLAPTSAPTTAPTAAPTSTPTTAPTAAPISFPWDLQQEGDVLVDFSAGGDKTAKFKYVKGKGRDYVHSLTAGTCGENVIAGEDVVATTPTVTAIPGNGTHEELEVAHAFNLSLVSTIPALYDTVKSVLRFCQSVGLVHNLADGGNYLIAQLETQVNVTLNMTSGFDVDVVTEKATVEQSDKNVTLTDVLDAYHCTGTDLVEVPAGAKLKPNDELSVCVVSKDTNFEIETLDNMYVSSGFKAPYDELKIVNNAAAVIDAITSLVQPTATSAVVTTRLPVNVIDYDAEGTVTIEGTATMKFQGGRRRLAVGGRALQAAAAGEEDAAFGVSISLAPVEEEAAGPLSGATALAAGSAAFAAGMAALLLAW